MLLSDDHMLTSVKERERSTGTEMMEDKIVQKKMTRS